MNGVLIAERVKPSGSRWNVFKSGYHAFSGLMWVAPRTPSFAPRNRGRDLVAGRAPAADPDQGAGPGRARQARLLCPSCQPEERPAQ